jgi:hypothetical protein
MSPLALYDGWEVSGVVLFTKVSVIWNREFAYVGVGLARN